MLVHFRIRFPLRLAAASIALVVAGGCVEETGMFYSETDAGVAADAGALPAAPGRPPETVPRTPPVGNGKFEPEPCWFTNMGNGFRCGRVSVPEDRAVPGGRQVRLAVAIFAPPTGIPHPDPLVYLEGGPGGQAIATVLSDIFRFSHPVFTGRYELVAIDQRGTGFSTPRLDCPEVADASREALATAATQSDDSIAASYAACRARLSSQASVAAYNTAASAEDIEDVRLALGYPPWNLLGVSYGTRLALEIMRAHPEGLRSVVLDSVAPPDVNWIAEIPAAFDRTLRELTLACERHGECGRMYPNLAEQVMGVARQLEAQPARVTVRYKTMFVNGQLFLALVRLLAYDRDGLPLIPEFIRVTSQGDHTMLTNVTRAVFDIIGDLDEGLHRSIVCAEVSPLPVAASTTLATAALDPLLRAAFSEHEDQVSCGVWNVPPVPAAQVAPVTSAVPTLLLSGHFDPATPPAFAAHVASTLSHALSFVLPTGSHGNFTSDCGRTLMLGFLDNPAMPPSHPCGAGTPQVPFKLGASRLSAASAPPSVGRLPDQAWQETFDRVVARIGRQPWRL